MQDCCICQMPLENRNELFLRIDFQVTRIDNR